MIEMAYKSMDDEKNENNEIMKMNIINEKAKMCGKKYEEYENQIIMKFQNWITSAAVSQNTKEKTNIHNNKNNNNSRPPSE